MRKNDLCPTCGGGVWPGRQITDCPDKFHMVEEPDLLDEIVAERTLMNHGFPQIVTDVELKHIKERIKDLEEKVRDLERKQLKRDRDAGWDGF